MHKAVSNKIASSIVSSLTELYARCVKGKKTIKFNFTSLIINAIDVIKYQLYWSFI